MATFKPLDDDVFVDAMKRAQENEVPSVDSLYAIMHDRRRLEYTQAFLSQIENGKVPEHIIKEHLIPFMHDPKNHLKRLKLISVLCVDKYPAVMFGEVDEEASDDTYDDLYRYRSGFVACIDRDNELAILNDMETVFVKPTMEIPKWKVIENNEGEFETEFSAVITVDETCNEDEIKRRFWLAVFHAKFMCSWELLHWQDRFIFSI